MDLGRFDMMVVFRTDASHEVGTGHVMRCLTLARKLRDCGGDCRFVCREHAGDLCALIRRSGFVVCVLPLETIGGWESQNETAHGHWLGADWRKDAEQTIAALGGEKPDWLIVDHYAIDRLWEGELRAHCGRIMVIDDLADRRHDCDLLLDQNLAFDYVTRYGNLLPEQSAVLLGPRYALLQQEYSELHPRTPPRVGDVRRVLVYFGGADQTNMTGRVIEALSDLNCGNFLVDVVSNSGSLHAADVRSQTAKLPWVKLHANLPTLAPLMLVADLAIGAGGTTTWERCCMGLPSLVVTIADNQLAGAAEANARGVLWWLGHESAVSVSQIHACVEKLLANPGELQRCSVLCRDLVDGLGVDRVVDNLMLGEDSPLEARPAWVTDESLLLTWANNNAVRSSGFNPEMITESGHRKWFFDRLRRPETCRIYIIHTKRNIAVGQVRFEFDQGEWEIHYSVAAEARRRGIGVVMLREAMRVHREAIGPANLKARVRTTNGASRKVFDKLGFRKVEHNEVQVVYSGSL